MIALIALPVINQLSKLPAYRWPGIAERAERLHLATESAKGRAKFRAR